MSRTQITEFNSQGAALGNWFRDWPKDSLAHLYSFLDRASAPFCENGYVLSGKERRFGYIFDRMKGEWDRESRNRASIALTQPRSLIGKMVEAAKCSSLAALVHLGLWELLFRPRISRQLDQWIKDFHPEVVFAMVTDLGYMGFARMLNERYGLPLCIEINDDWPNTLYRNSLFGRVMFPLVDRTFRGLLARAPVCLTIGKEMEREYKIRYKVRTEASMCCEEPERFATASPKRFRRLDEISIVYCGQLNNNRWKSMLDLCHAVEALRGKGRDIGVTVHSSEVPSEGRAALSKCPWAKLLETPRHEDVVGIMKGADILFHGESFDAKYQDYIRFSVSSKIQLYMLSDVPILVYGPAGVGVVEYARQGGWAFVVDRQGPVALENAILRLLHDSSLRGQIIEKAQKTFAENHNAHVVRERLRQVLCQVAAGRPRNDSTSGEVQRHV